MTPRRSDRRAVQAERPDRAKPQRKGRRRLPRRTGARRATWSLSAEGAHWRFPADSRNRALARLRVGHTVPVGGMGVRREGGVMTKWNRLFNALVNCQAASGAGKRYCSSSRLHSLPLRVDGWRAAGAPRPGDGLSHRRAGRAHQHPQSVPSGGFSGAPPPEAEEPGRPARAPLPILSKRGTQGGGPRVGLGRRALTAAHDYR